MKTSTIVLTVSALTISSFCIGCGGGVDETRYVPSKEFLPAYNAFMEAYEEAPSHFQADSIGKVVKVSGAGEGEYYDLEETVRILNGLELAQTQTEDFYSFLEYMSRQDYTMVPKEVIEAKLELLPIMQEMFMLEKENAQMNGLTAVLGALETGLYELVKERSLAQTASGMIDAAAAITSPLTSLSEGGSIGDAINKIIDAESIEGAKSAAFENYEAQQKLKEENSRKIDVLKAKYLAYLSHFTPIYTKYIKEWERLCIDKDKAYLAAYSGRPVDCYETTRQILETYPANREAMLLKALACINIAKSQSVTTPIENTLPAIGEDNSAQKYRFTIDARNTLESYIDLYPGKAAPALVLLGELELIEGNSGRALSYFDQAAIEYPKQAQELKDMLNSYILRDYLNSTAEGSYLMRLYCSTMEGYGWFSPNFHKALYWESLDDNEKAANEIYNHFFRRDHQGLYDCLLTDMEFCETYLFKSFKSQFMESSALNISVTADNHMIGKNGVRFTLSNNSDLPYENVRLYICLHLKDMYISEYEVFPCETINIFKPGESQSWTTTDYTVEDIVRVRAVMLTDERVCWVDDIEFKQANAMKNYYQKQGQITKPLDMFAQYGLSEPHIIEKMTKEISGHQFSAESKIRGFFKNSANEAEPKTLTIEMPRIVCLLDPVFSLGELSKNQTPTRQSLDGSMMKIEFALDSAATDEPLYLYSNFINLKISYKIDESGELSVTSVEKI